VPTPSRKGWKGKGDPTLFHPSWRTSRGARKRKTSGVKGGRLQERKERKERLLSWPQRPRKAFENRNNYKTWQNCETGLAGESSRGRVRRDTTNQLSKRQEGEGKSVLTHYPANREQN